MLKVIIMGREWQIGDPVDYTTDGWMDAQNWGHGSDGEDESREDNGNSVRDKSKEYASKAWDLYMDFREDEALSYINQALDLDDRNPNNWNVKAIILEAQKRFEESEECYDKSLDLSEDNVVYDNRARMLYGWAAQLLEESKHLSNGMEKLGEAEKKIVRSIRSLSADSDEDIERYLRLRDSIIFSIGYEEKFQWNLETLESYERSELFTISGMKFYHNDIHIVEGMALRLVREPDNEFDRDAIAVYVEDKKIGYVANNDHTKFEMTSSASQLCDEVRDVAQAEYLIYLDRYSDIQFHIARIIK